MPAGFLAATLLVPAACSLPDETAATVNDRPIPTAELESAYEGFLDQFDEIVPPGAQEAEQTRRVLLERLIDRELMRQEAERAGVLPTEKEVREEIEQLTGELKDKELDTVLAEAGLDRDQWIAKIERDLTLQKLQEVVFEQIAVEDQEIAAYAARHRITDEVPGMVRASQILVRTREEAVSARRRIRAGESFADVARDTSLSPDAQRGGDLGYFSRGQMPQEFDAVVFSLPEGKLSPVVETTYGFHLFLVTDRREPRRRSESEIREEIRTVLAAEKKEAAFKTFVATLREQAEIRYNTDVIAP